jgi:hypothetical protein
MNTITLNAIAAAKTVAETILGYGDPEGVILEHDGASVLVRPLGEYADFTEIRLPGSASVTIERPRAQYGRARKATVTWSSSSSTAEGTAAAATTARLIAFGVEVADQMNAWVTSGDYDVPGLTPPAAPADAPLRRGDTVEVDVFRAGPPSDKPIGTVRGTILNAGIEYDVILTHVDDDDVENLLWESGADLTLKDLEETLTPGAEPVHIFRNCQPEWVRRSLGI